VVSAAAEMRIEVYNSLGQLVEILANGKYAPGTYRVEFSAANHPSGLYYYRLVTNNFSEVKKMMLIR